MSGKEAKPNLDESQASELMSRLYGLTVAELHPLPSYDDQNFHVVVSEGGGGSPGQYVLKIMNTVFSRNPDQIELQTFAMSFLHQHGLPAQTVLPSLTCDLMSLESIDCGFGTQKYVVRLLTYLPGATISKVPCSPQLLFQVGRMAATMDTVLQKMKHPKLSWALEQQGRSLWSLGNVPMLEPYLPAARGEILEHIAKEVIKMFKTEVLVNMSSFRKCIIHGDFNNLNILVEPDGQAGHRISGILDFGDMGRGYYAFELAIAIMHMMVDSGSPLDVGGAMLAGWESVLPLNEAERGALYALVLGRFCQTLLLARHFVTLYPENEEYLMNTSHRGTAILRTLWETGREAVLAQWFGYAAAYADGK